MSQCGSIFRLIARMCDGVLPGFHPVRAKSEANIGSPLPDGTNGRCGAAPCRIITATNEALEEFTRFSKVKAFSIFSLLLLLGCAPSTPDLIEQAHLTGDWTLVNKRMEAIERREARKPMSCPRGSTLVCNDRFGRDRCACVSNADVRQMLGSMGY